MENVILKLFKLLCLSSLNLPNHAFLSTFSHRITGMVTPYKYTDKAIIHMSMPTFLTKIIGCIHRFSRKKNVYLHIACERKPHGADYLSADRLPSGILY